MKELFLLLLCSVCFTTAANDPVKDKGRISGRVLDKETQQVLEFVPVTLMTLDSAVVSGVLSSADGSFELKELPDNTYLVKVDFIGFESQFTRVDITPDQREIDMGDVLLSSAGNLDAVEVVGESSAFKVEIDKKIYDPDKNPDNQGGTGLDVMRNVPSIDVDPDDNITLRGDANVNILIDGRPVAIPISQLLKQLPAAAIDEIEIITNPSAKYDPEGTSGIINIKLKKNDTKGLNGNTSLSAGYGNYYKANAGVSLNFMSNKLNISSALNGSSGLFGYGGTLDRTLLGDTTYGLTYLDDGVTSGYTGYGSLGFDYFLNDKNTLYLNGSAVIRTDTNYRALNYEFLQDEVLTSTSDRVSHANNAIRNFDVNGGWQKKFVKDGHELSLDGRWSSSQTPNGEDIFQSYFDQTGILTGDDINQVTENNTNRELRNVRLDYTNPVSDSFKLEFGFHYTGRSAEDDFYSESWDAASDVFYPDTSLNNEFHYTQNVYAPYATAAKQFKGWGLKVGLRAEQTYTLSELINTQEEFRNDYFALFPSAHLSLGKTPFSQWQVSYSRRINRPETEELNPFTSYTDPFTLQTGNPFLRPEFIHVFEAGHNWIKEKFSLMSTVYYRLITDQKRRYVYVEDNISIVSYDNLASSDLKGAEVILGFHPGQTLRSNLTLNYWHNTVNDPSAVSGSNNSDNQGWSANLQVTKSFKFGLTAQLSGDYRGKMRVVQGYIKPSGAVNFSLRQKILKGRGSIGVRAQDIFRTRNFSFVGDALNGYTFASDRYWESRQVWVSFSYFFGKMIQGKQRKQIQSSDATDDVRGGGM